MQSVASILKKAQNILLKYGWVQNSYGSKAEGFCLLGALSRASQDAPTFWEARAAVSSLLEAKTGYTVGPTNWNDRITTTYEDVIYLLDDAIDSAEGARL